MAASSSLSKEAIREFLRADRPWSVYAIGDLAPPEWDHCTWFTPGLALLYRGFDTPVLFAMPGSAAAAVTAARTLRGPAHLQLQDAELRAVAGIVPIASQTAMWRMRWQGAPSTGADAIRIKMENLAALERLYSVGEAAGDGPDFFFPSMLRQGIFYGVWKDGELVSIAGTHIYKPEEGIAAIGNVYTHPSWRGRGLARRAMLALLAAIQHLETVALSVRQDNAPAIHLYESMGFITACSFWQAVSAAPAPTT